MWFYSQKGKLDKNGTFAGIGYSGFGVGCNASAYQQVASVGPIPQGGWKIVALEEQTEAHGPYVLKLQPNENTETYGRSGFLIHGDSISHAGCASHGCIILSRALREAIWKSEDHDLCVTA